MQRARPVILIADDTPSNIELMGEVLGGDYDVLFALNGREALEIALAETPDLILLDVMMPEMNGYDACARLKADPRLADTPVIFITALGHETDEARGLDLGAIDYVTKPVSPVILLARVRNHLELKRRGDLLKGLSFMDGLTGLANRRRLDQFLDMEWRRGARSALPLSMIMMDIDFFKQYNDTYGHAAGDDCLRRVAMAIGSAVLRPSDLLARYGGEEFTCVLPDTLLDGALTVAEHIQDQVRRLALPHGGSAVAPHVTLSMGVATVLPDLETSIEALILAADGLLYQAKREGRNGIRTQAS